MWRAPLLIAVATAVACGGDPKPSDTGPDCAPATWHRDADFDGVGSDDELVDGCVGEIPSGYAAEGGDCDDHNPSVHAGATEACNGFDDDCNGTVDDNAAGAPEWFTDADGDGFGDAMAPITSCTEPTGAVYNADDCDDTDRDVHPDATEACDGVDEDCDGIVDNPDQLPSETYWADTDGDGYGDPATATDSCTPISGYVPNGADCDDTEATTHPDAEDVCEDGVDNDCENGDKPCILIFSGIQTNVDVSTLNGWTECFSTTYSSSVPISNITDACTGTHLMLGCRQTGSTVMTAVAYAPVADVMFDTGTGNTLHNANGVDWYYSGSYSWGYVHEGDGVSRNSCDTQSGTYPGERLCWHTSGSALSGGYRCGSTTGLNSSTTWDRVVFTGDVPE